MSFKLLAIATSVATLLLAAGWLLAGRSMLKRWRITAMGTDLVLGRRIGAIYLGFSAIFFLARNAPPSELRHSLCIGAFAVCALLAGLGLYEYKAGRVGPAIFISVAVEVFLLIGYAMVLLSPGNGALS